ncbi:MAG TPA: class I SAM-dependent methyltransferase [Gemmatimonadaceae bacterium]|nr:class I SAM-dependent methyltransferase [Gemmatimonadaceae bacterium]
MRDRANGYESVAAQYIAGRGTGGTIGVRQVRDWAATLVPGGTVLDVGCGPGYPITQVLVDAGFHVYGVDASPSMVAAFSARFPEVDVVCEPVETSTFFGRTFDGVIAWGLLFLLRPAVQERVIRKVARALAPNGRFVFTAPRQAAEWNDAMTGLPSVSLGADRYRHVVHAAGLTLIGEAEDEGESHYFMTSRG